MARGKKYSDYAVLYRMNSQSLSFERMFAKQAIPHRIIGGTRFFDRREVRDMIAYLSVIENPEDQVRLERIINTPKRAIGQKTVDTALEIAQQTGESLYRVISHAEDFPLLSRTAAKLKGFVALIDRLAARNRGGMPPSELYGELLEQTGYLAFLRTDEPDKAEERVENVQELSSMLQRYEQEAGDDASLEDFLEEVALFTDIDNYDAGADSVVLMTMHAAKGLEFPTVFLPGWEEGVFPGSAVLYDPAQVEEERRLAYVALTRAREAVYLYHAQSRMIFGTTSHNRLSRFAQEIPPQLVEETRSLPAFTRPEWSKAPEEGIWTRDGFTGKLPDSRGPRAGAFARETYQPHPVKPAPAGTYRTGGTVRHRTFGTGVILNATPMANDTLLEIAFEQVGTKKLFANFARLEKL